MSKITCFNKYIEATIAALELVIQRYGHEPWFNGILRKLMSSLHIKPCHETFSRPLIFHHEEREDGTVNITNYFGYHYLITEMEKYDKISKLKYLSPLLVLNIALLIFCFSILIKINIIYQPRDINRSVTSSSQPT